MKRTAIIAAALVALTSPAFGLDYDCSPLTGGCTPRASQPSAFDSPMIVYAPRPLPSLDAGGPGRADRDQARRYRRR
jgi:hypothetical protein